MDNVEFKKYTSKEIIRRATEIVADDIVTKCDTESAVSEWILSRMNFEPLRFVAYKTPCIGDFICLIASDDIYHVPRDVFLERNVVD